MTTLINKISLRYVTEDGEELETIPDSFKPLGYEELTGSKSSYSIEVKAGPGKTKLNGTTLEKGYTCNFPITFNEEVTIYVLVQGGWLPISFINHPNIIPDRNVISSIQQIKNGKIRNNTKSTAWWLTFHRKSDLTINPLLYACEGNKKRLPTFQEFCTSFDEASQDIKNFFPNAKVVSYTDKYIYKQAYELLLEISRKNAVEEEFLLETASLVAIRPPDNEIADIQDAIDNVALKLNILGESLAYYLVISCLYDAKDGSGYQSARKVLKPNQNYKKEQAYNTISDLNAINLFIQSLSFPDIVFPICTCDKPLAAFWASINPIARSVKNRKINVSFQLTEHLFPRLESQEIAKLGERINYKKTFLTNR